MEKRLVSNTAEQNLKLFDIKNRAAIKKERFQNINYEEDRTWGLSEDSAAKSPGYSCRTRGPRRRFQLPHGASRPSLSPVPWLLTFFGLVHT